MSVVQRCQNCGTTQATAGECKTCHEAQVRYYCTNHEPGIWLDGPECPQCAARSMPATRPSVAKPTPALRARPTVLIPEGDAVGAGPARTSSVDEDSFDLRPPRSALWEKLLGGALARRSTSLTAERDPASGGDAGGWLKQLVIRLALIAVVLGVGLLAAIYLLARSMD